MTTKVKLYGRDRHVCRDQREKIRGKGTGSGNPLDKEANPEKRGKKGDRATEKIGQGVLYQRTRV